MFKICDAGFIFMQRFDKIPVAQCWRCKTTL